MCAPFSPTDSVETAALTSLDLADAAGRACVAIAEVVEIVRKVAIDDATGAQLGPRGAHHATLALQGTNKVSARRGRGGGQPRSTRTP